jgi:hypothetical protein
MRAEIHIWFRIIAIGYCLGWGGGNFLKAALAQFNSFPPGAFIGKPARDPASGGGGGYTGPIDINGTAYAFWSTRCGAAAYSGNILDVWDGATGSTTETVLGCDGAGNIVVKSGSALATTCAVSCAVTTIYDQSGGNHCGGAACDLTQATNSSRPTLTTSCQNGKSCMVCAPGSSQTLTNATGIASTAQPSTQSWVSERTGATGSFGDVVGFNGGNLQFGFNAGANAVFMYASTNVETATANDSVLHAVQMLLNRASSSFYIDGSLTAAGGDPGTVTVNGGISICSSNGGSNFATGQIFEVGIWAGDNTANNASMNSNQHTYWGF